MQKEQKKFRRRAVTYTLCLIFDIILLVVSIINSQFSTIKSYLALGAIFVGLVFFYSWKYKQSRDFDFYDDEDETKELSVEDYWEEDIDDSDGDIYEDDIQGQ